MSLQSESAKIRDQTHMVKDRVETIRRLEQQIRDYVTVVRTAEQIVYMLSAVIRSNPALMALLAASNVATMFGSGYQQMLAEREDYESRRKAALERFGIEE